MTPEFSTSVSRTTRCAALGHPELELPIQLPLVRELKLDAWLTSYFEEAVSKGTVFRANETIQLGWRRLRLVDAGSGLLSVAERDLATDQWVPGADATLRDLWFQRAVADSLLPRPPLTFPNESDGAIVCSEVLPATRKSFARSARTDDSSGWQFTCLDDAHDHERDGAMIEVDLVQVAELLPVAVQFFALPPDVRVSLSVLSKETDEETRLWVDVGDHHKRPIKIIDGSYLHSVNQHAKSSAFKK